MRKVLLFYVVTIALMSAAQNPGARPFDDEAIRDMLEGFAIMEADNEGDPHQQNLPTVADCYRMMEKRCEEAGVDKRRILDVAKEEIDRCAAYVKSTGRTSIAINAVRLLDLVAHSGDRSLLPYLEEKSLDPETLKFIRSAAAEVYVNIADVEESVNLLRKLYDDRSFRESRYYYVSGLFLQKVKSEEKSLTDEVKRDICTHLLAIVQSADSPGDALDAEFFLRDFLPGYTNSKQRATLVRYANIRGMRLTLSSFCATFSRDTPTASNGQRWSGTPTPVMNT
ncbi:MAG: hypothetical protein ACOX7Q_01245 [Kiritimatiellia bacterium]